VAAWQQHQFVWCSSQLKVARQVSGWNWCPAKRGKHNAHLYGFSHHHGSGHWSWRLFLAPSGGRGHTACAAPQIVSGFIPCGSGLLPCGSSQPRSDLVRPGLLELADQPMPTTQSTRAPSPCHWRPAMRGAVPGSVTTMPSPSTSTRGLIICAVMRSIFLCSSRPSYSCYLSFG